jgi:hypothetical protein
LDTATLRAKVGVLKNPTSTGAAGVLTSMILRPSASSATYA